MAMEDAYSEGVPYFCPSCDFESPNIDVLQQHRVLGHTAGELKDNVSICNKEKNTLKKNVLNDIEVETAERFDEELLKKEEANKIYRCHLCSKVYESVNGRTSLGKHIKAVHLDLKYQCYACGKNLTTKSYLQFHIQNVHNRKSTILNDLIKKCGECDFVTYYNRDMKDHAHVAHSGLQFECEVCNKSFTKLRILQYHNQHYHENRELICGTCKKSFTSERSLITHIQDQHNLKEYICDFCSFISKSKQIHALHLKKKHEEKSQNYKEIDHICYLCGKQTKTKDALRHHIGYSHEFKKPIRKRYPCAECKILLRKAYTRCSDHTQTCGKCSFVTSRSGQLKKHQSTLSCNKNKGNKNFKCGTCSFSFTTEKSMNKHKQEHINGKPFKCDKCGVGFTQRYAVRTHLKTGVCKKDGQLDCQYKPYGF